MQRHTHQEFSASSTPSSAPYWPANWSTPVSTITPPTSIAKSTPGSPATRAGVFHFTPTSGSWLNAVENLLQDHSPGIRRGVFRSIAELQAAINWCLKDTMMIPGPSSGPTGDVILPKLNRLPVPSV
jgi:hypothetical protein